MLETVYPDKEAIFKFFTKKKFHRLTESTEGKKADNVPAFFFLPHLYNRDIRLRKRRYPADTGIYSNVHYGARFSKVPKAIHKTLSR